jgi:hypothetical protein
MLSLVVTFVALLYQHGADLGFEKSLLALIDSRRRIHGCKRYCQPPSDSCGWRWGSFHICILNAENRE